MNAVISRVCITGAGGFIGSRLTRALFTSGVDVRALLGAPDDVVHEPPPGVHAVRGDITDVALLRELVRGSDIVIHLAGPPSVGASFDDPQRYVHAHVAGTTNVLEACRVSKVSRLVYLSSAEIYGNAGEEPVEESFPPNPRSPYAAAKLAAEAMVRSFVHFSDLTACVLRPFSVYGPGQSQYSLVQTLVRQARADDAIALSDLKPIRDYCFVDDLIDAVIAGCSASVERFAPFNIGSGVGTSVRELAEMVLALTGKALPIITNGAVSRPLGAEIYALVANIERAKRELDWRPRTTLSAGLQKLLLEDGNG